MYMNTCPYLRTRVTSRSSSCNPPPSMRTPTSAAGSRRPATGSASDLAGTLYDSWMHPDVGELLELMDAQGVAACVNLDGRWDAELEANLDRYDRARPGRFLTFCQLDWRLAAEDDGFGDLLAASLRRSAAAGRARAQGLEGRSACGYSDAAGDAAAAGRPARGARCFATAGELGLPVLIHTADPVAFWDPVEPANERYEDAARAPRVVPTRAEGSPATRGSMELVRGAGGRASRHRPSSARTWPATSRTSTGSGARSPSTPTCSWTRRRACRSWRPRHRTRAG